MAVCLDYQAVYYDRRTLSSSTRLHLIAAFVLLIALSFKVWMKVETIELGYELAKQRELVVQYDMERRDLELQLSLLTRPDNLKSLATERLGMNDAAMDQIIKIGPANEEVR